ncbi:acetyl-CoA C-acyltransferase [Numidum massiliense]|uniref:acetyl-CoA C-acyltransferase n=1 Tax=Numidum massiliense TaxID=1522315 RepID=UPI0006D57AB1|nr:acetyl-CoA C-acyltransferase [Numidum massiliense]
MREAVIVAGVRSAVGKARRGSLKDTRPDDYGAEVVKALLARVPEVAPEEIDDLYLGCAFPEGEQGMNVGRIIGQRAGLPVEVSGVTMNRFCASGLQTIGMAAASITSGFADIIVAGGVESMTMVPMGGNKPAPNPYLMDNYPEVYMSMGHTAEEVARQYGVTREEQDEFAVASHQKAYAAIQAGRFKDEIAPLRVKVKQYSEDKGLQVTEKVFDTDEGVRPDTTLDVLASLRPAFLQTGTVTAGNSSQMSDGAAAVMVMSAEKAQQLGLKPLAVFRSFAVGGVAPDVMGIGPVAAVPKALKTAGLTLDQIDLIELNEAFASQSIQVIRALEMDPARVNVNGGAIALGHPLGCSGAKLTVTLLHELKRRGGKYGLVTMCIGGGMGAAGVLEMVS